MPLRQLDLRLDDPVAPDHAVDPVRRRRRERWCTCCANCGQLVGYVGAQRCGGVVGAVVRGAAPTSKPCDVYDDAWRWSAARSGRRTRCSRRHCQFADRAPGRAVATRTRSNRPAVPPFAWSSPVADHDRLEAAREVPEPRQRLAVAVHRARSGWPAAAAARRPAGSPTLLRLTQSVRAGAAEVHVVRPDRRAAVALLARPGRVALSRVAPATAARS